MKVERALEVRKASAGARKGKPLAFPTSHPLTIAARKARQAEYAAAGRKLPRVWRIS